MMRVGFDEAFPLWMLSTPDVGGLGWENKEIGEVRRDCRSSYPILLRRYWRLLLVLFLPATFLCLVRSI